MVATSKLRALAAQVPGHNVVAQARLARDLAAAGDAAEAMRLALAALEGCAHDPVAARKVSAIFAPAVDEPYLAYLRDEARVRAYDAAIRRAVTPGMRVLEIGCGTGLFAMMAARAGATVSAYEQNPIVAAMAARAVAQNGLSDRIRIAAGAGWAADLDAPVDLIIAELVPRGTGGRSADRVVADAAREFLREDGQVIPARAMANIALVEDGAQRFHTADDCAGFDMRALNAMTGNAYLAGGFPGGLSLRSAAVRLPALDLRRGMLEGAGAGSVDLVADGGAVNGIAQWFVLDLDDAGRYANAPGSTAAAAWQVQVFPFRTPTMLAQGAVVPVGYDFAGALDLKTPFA